MSEDAERIKKLVSFKKKIEARVDELEFEHEELQAILETVNSLLLEKGFKRVEVTAKPSVPDISTQEEKAESAEFESGLSQTGTETETVAILKSATGEVLADFYIDDGALHVVPAEDKNFDINTPPFNQFLVQRVLLKMQERDSELARAGQLSAEKILCFDIVRDGDVIRKIVIRNFGSDRLRELKSSIRWTFEKMLEKTRG
jgi:hypothetical protein